MIFRLHHSPIPKVQIYRDIEFMQNEQFFGYITWHLSKKPFNINLTLVPKFWVSFFLLMVIFIVIFTTSISLLIFLPYSFRSSPNSIGYDFIAFLNWWGHMLYVIKPSQSVLSFSIKVTSNSLGVHLFLILSQFLEVFTNRHAEIDHIDDL